MSSRWCTWRWRPGPPDGAAEWCSSVLLRDTVPSWHRELSPPTTCCQLSAVGTQTLLSFTTHFTDAGCQAGPSIRKPSLKVTPTILETFSSCDHELCQRRILSIKWSDFITNAEVCIRSGLIIIIIIIITKQGDLRLAPTSPVQTKIQLK